MKKIINLLKCKKDKTKRSHKCVHAVNVRMFDAENDCELWISIKFEGMGRLDPWNVKREPFYNSDIKKAKQQQQQKRLFV